MRNLLSLLFCLLSVSVNLHSQNKSGIIVGSGIGFESYSTNTNSKDFKIGIKNKISYNYDVQLGYRFRFEAGNAPTSKIFFDVDPLLKLQAFKTTKEYPTGKGGYNSPSVEAPDINFQFAISPSANYRITNRLFAGVGVEPTWNIVTNGKHFDIPAFCRVGYSFKRVELALTYRQGFLNVLDKDAFDKGRASDLNISLFIPLFTK